jgi:perosamine synthetase
MYIVRLKGSVAAKRAKVMSTLAINGVDSRENFLPYNMQDIFINRGWTTSNECPVANDLGLRSFYLPSGPVISDIEIDYVCEKLCQALDQ